jgi:hypothetical protein
VPRPDDVEVERVDADEQATGPEHAGHLGEDLVLERGGLHVVEHREARDRGEAVRLQAGEPGIGADDVDVGSPEAVSEGLCQIRVDLESCQVLDSCSEEIRRETRARPYLEDVVSEVSHGLHPGQEVGLEQLRPFGAAEELDVGLVHRTVVR